MLQEDVVHDQLRPCFPLRRPEAVTGGPAVLFGVDNMPGVGSVTRKMLEHHHRGSRVVPPLPPHFVQVVGVAGGRAVARAGLTGAGAAHHPGLRHDGVERVHLHVDVTAVAPRLLPQLPLVARKAGQGAPQLELPGSGPHLGSRHTAVQGPAKLRQS